MAETSGIFPSVNGDRKYFTAFFAEYFADFIGNGIYPNPSTQCQVLANGDMTVTLKPGNAYINGYKYKNDSDLTLTLDTADGVLKRIDRVVIRKTTLDREIKAYVKKGTFASSPVAQDLQQDDDVWELGIADIYVANGAGSISQSAITDLRLNNTYCGIVSGVVEKVDTSTLFNQYQSWIAEKQTQFNSSLVNYAATKQLEIDQTQDTFEQDFNSWLTAKKAEFNDWMIGEQSGFYDWETSEKTDFDTWFGTIRGVLTSEAAGNLLSLIDGHKADVNNPHDVTAEQIGLENVENTADADKPVSIAQQEVFDEISLNSLLIDEKIKNTIQELTFSTDGNISEVKHMRGEEVIRHDVFTVTYSLIQEVRTLNTGEMLTVKNHIENGMIKEVEVI